MIKKIEKKNEILKLDEFLMNFFKAVSVDVDYSIERDEDQKSLNVIVKTKDDSAGLLIGSKGRNLNSLQLILSLIFRENLKEGERLVVDIDGFRESETQRIIDLAQKTADRVISNKQPQNLYNLTPYQRRIVHTALSEIKGIKTESFGEGDERYLVVTSS